MQKPETYTEIRLKMSPILQLIGYAQGVNAFPKEPLPQAWRDRLLTLANEAEETYMRAFR